MSEEQKKDELVKVQNAALQSIPSHIQVGNTAGMEDDTTDDLRPPRLCLAQGLSPQLIEGDPAYIEGLKVNDIFNDLTGEVYGRGPIEFAFVRCDRPRGIEFIPREEGGGVRDFDVPLNDPRMQFTKDKDGNSIKPVATKFYDYVLVLIPTMEVVALSLKSSGLKVAAKIKTMLKGLPVPTYARRFQLQSVQAKGPKGPYATWTVRQSPTVDIYTQEGKPGWFNADTFEFLNTIAESLKGRNLVIDRESPDSEETEDGPVPF